MTWQLHVIAGPDEGKVFGLTPGEPLVIGRSQATNTRLTDPRASRIHCEVQLENNQVTVVDANSAAGTLVNNQRVMQQALQAGDILQVGETQLRLVDTTLAEQSTLAPAGPPSPKPAIKVPESLTQLSGQTLSHYDIGPVVAQGTSGVVFRACDTRDRQVVALKVLKPEFAGNEGVQRFVRAMKTMLPIRHPNLVALQEAGKTGPYCWVAMEYIEGESLTQVIARIGVAGMLDWRHGLRVAIHIGRALEYAHQQHIIHRNVAPPNILIQSSDKIAKLGDLMLAKALEGNLAQSITRSGEIVGDVSYMSPERTGGQGDVDGRSDIYSLGATVYTLLTGRPPFLGGSLTETITRIRQAEPVRPKKFQLAIPDLLEGSVLKMLAKRPQDRYQTATDLLNDLNRVATFQGLIV
jgi:serine/threonine protein kinase